MPFVQAKCTNCGADLKVDNSKDAAICEFCGTPFIIEKAINNYNITNNISGSTVNIYGGNSSDFVIRAGTLEKYIGASTEVVIPDTVSIIGPSAFKGCQALKSISIPNTVVKIGGEAFSGCLGLTKIDIPNSVIEIGGYAFDNCSGLSFVTIPDNVKGILSGVFRDCTSLKSISLGDNIEGLEGTFFNCSDLVSISFGKSIKSIYSKAFSGCNNLKYVNFRGKISDFCQISNDWRDSWHESFICTDMFSTAGLYINGELVTEIKESDLLGIDSIAESVFAGYKYLKSVTIPRNIKKIGNLSFAGCEALTELTFKSIVYIERNSFLLCKNLKIINNSFNTEEYYYFIDNSSDWDNRKAWPRVLLKQSKSENGCYIATSVYGSYDCPEVWTLRRYRDYSLALTWYGRLFITIYYAISPAIVRWFGHTKWFNKMWRGKLDRIVEKLQSEGFENTPYEDQNWK